MLAGISIAIGHISGVYPVALPQTRAMKTIKVSSFLLSDFMPLELNPLTLQVPLLVMPLKIRC